MKGGVGNERGGKHVVIVLNLEEMRERGFTDEMLAELGFGVVCEEC